MARIRTVKPDAFRSPSMRRLSIAARYVFIGLITEADDEGRFLASAKALAGALFPHDEDVTATKFEGWLQEIVVVGSIELYESDGVRYGWFPKWIDHQKISHPSPSRLPSPSGANLVSSQNGSALKGTGNREQGTGKPAVAVAFEKFWKVYPRRVGKRKAEAAFTQATRRASAEEIIAGAERYRDDPHRTPEFTAHPTTWLNADRWGDESTVVAPPVEPLRGMSPRAPLREPGLAVSVEESERAGAAAIADWRKSRRTSPERPGDAPPNEAGGVQGKAPPAAGGEGS